MATESANHGEFHFNVVHAPADTIVFPTIDDTGSPDDGGDDTGDNPGPGVDPGVDTGVDLDVPNSPDTSSDVTIPNGDGTDMDLHLFFSQGNTYFDTSPDDATGTRSFSLSFDDDWHIDWSSAGDDISIVHHDVTYDLVPQVDDWAL